MKNKKFILPLTLLLICGLTSCGETNASNTGSDNSNSSTSTPSTSTPVNEGLYTKLSRGLTNLSKSFTALGTLETYVYDGTSGKQEIFDCKIEISEDAYYYQESDFTTQDITFVENYFSGQLGRLGYRFCNPLTNEVEEILTNTLYKNEKENPIKDLEVRKLKGIRDQQNWYIVSDNYIAGTFTTMLTGYPVSVSYDDTGFQMTEFAMHFDGDNFDQMRILLEYEEEYDETTSYFEQFLFTLDIMKYGTTVPSVLKAYDTVSEHSKLEKAFEPFADVDNYTINLDVSYNTKDLDPENYHYYVDIKNGYLFSDEIRYGSRRVDSGEFEQYPYIIGYKNTFDNNTEALFYYRFDPDTKELVDSGDYNKYMGTNASNYRTLDYLMPMVGEVAPGSYKSLGNNKFGSYYLTKEYCIRALVPYEEYYYGSGNFELEVLEDYSLKLVLTEKIIYSTSDTTYNYATKTTTITYSNIGSTVIDDCLINA